MKIRHPAAAAIVLLIFTLGPSLFAQTDFNAFWSKFKAAVAANNKAAVAEMTKFPVSMPSGIKPIKDKQGFSQRFNEIFQGEANAAQCFATAKPERESAQRCSVYCPFKQTPEQKDNAPIRFIFELTRNGWKFVGLDNINE